MVWPIEEWLKAAESQGASDLHVVVGHKPTIRLNGRLVGLDFDTLSTDVVAENLASLCSPEQMEKLHDSKNIDFALVLPQAAGEQRFRANGRQGPHKVCRGCGSRA